MKKFFLLLTITFFSIALFAQEDEISAAEAAAAAAEASKLDVKPTKTVPDSLTWMFSGVVGTNLSQTQLWNWAAGGNNNFTGVIFANLFLRYKKNKISWDSNLDTDLGFMYASDTKFPWRKSNDKINFATKLGWEFKPKWFLTLLGGFKSQYIAGYDYKEDLDKPLYTSNWASPSYTDLSLGIDWKPNKIFSVYYSPIAGRLTTVMDSMLRPKYGMQLIKQPDIYKNYKAEVGMTFKGAVLYQDIENLKIMSTIVLFTPYTKKFGNINVDWDFLISYRFLKVLNVSLSTSLKYYDEIMIELKDGKKGPRVQFMEVLGVGIGYSF